MADDLEDRSKQVPGIALHHIHNMALFECMVWLNSVVALVDAPEEAADEYYDFAEILKIKYMDIVNELKDFQPSK